VSSTFDDQLTRMVLVPPDWPRAAYTSIGRVVALIFSRDTKLIGSSSQVTELGRRLSPSR